MSDPGIEMSRRLRKAMGHADEPGTCADCGGMGVVPDTVATIEGLPGTHVRALWKSCPTCQGNCVGGRA